MRYRKYGDTYLVRIDRGEEIVEQVKALARTEGIRLASVQALGAVSEFTVGVFNVDERKYRSNSFRGVYEIASLTGTIDTLEGEVYTHLHLCAAGEQGQAFGGHLDRAVVSAVCEMVVRVLPGTADRSFDEALGLNLFRF